MTYIVICLEQMKEARDWSSRLTREQDILTTLQRSRPLLKYVLSYGFDHFSYLGPENSGIFEDLERLLVTISRRNWEWSRLCRLVPSVRSGTLWPTSEHDVLLYILIAFGSDALFQIFVRRTTLMPREGTNPFVYAAHLGKTEHTRILISQGVDSNLRGLMVDSKVTTDSNMDAMVADGSDEDDLDSDNLDMDSAIDRKAIALEVAVEHWHAEIVDLLLVHRCTIPNRLLARVLAQHPHDFPLNIINSLLQTPKFAQWAISPWENQGLLEALVDHAEDDGQADGREDLARATRRLVEVGCGETLFLLAVEKGCISIIEALLSMSTSSASDLSSASHPHCKSLI